MKRLCGVATSLPRSAAAIADYLVLRYIPNAPNEDSGAWVEETVIRGLSADEAQKAAEQSGALGRLRVVRWDFTEEYEGQPGPPVFSKVVKAET